MTALDPALHWSILCQPEDDTVRLALADWLDENGETAECGRCYGSGWSKPGPTNQPKCHNCGNSSQNATPIDNRNMRRCATCKMLFEPLYCPICSGSGRVSDGRAELAEFIRVQVELARLVPQWKEHYHYRGRKECGKCRIKKLADRESDLFKLVPLWWDMGFKVTHWSRGFVSEIELTCEQFMHHAPAIFRSQPVTEVRLTDREPWENGYGRWLTCGGTDRHGRRHESIGEPLCWASGNGRELSGKEGHATPDLARASLSRACVKYGRAAVGLPPLQARPAPAPVPDEVMR